LFAARLVQARQLRGLSQRALGDRMGLGKDKGSSRINRYERQVTAIGFDNLEKLAEVLDVPVAYLLADSASMADAILALSKAGDRQRATMAAAIKGLTETPALAKALAKMLQLPEQERKGAVQGLQALLAELGHKREST
jgi:transcriptional regulator with XRE-family HTH domain